MSKLMPSALAVEIAYRREPSGLSAAETNVFGSSSSGAPIGFWVATSQSTTVPSAAAVISVRPSGENSGKVMRAV